jgi:hypothetical protein
MLSDGIGADGVRVTVRLPKDLHEALVPLVPGRGLGWLIRKALTHYLACPERVRADAETEATLQGLLASLAASRGH